MPDTFLYFAYGSNMLTERLRARCPSAAPRGVATAPGYALEFTKRSVDGSAKATLVADGTSGAAVPGVLFEIARADLPHLDAAEGVGIGYDRYDAFRVMRHADNAPMIAATYLAPARARDGSLVAFDWYVALALAGALQHRLPAAHVAALRRTMMQPDPHGRRATRLEAVAVLREAGFAHLLDLG